MRIVAIGAALAVVLLSPTGPAQARGFDFLPLSARVLQAGREGATLSNSGEQVSAPRGFVAMCAREALLCERSEVTAQRPPEAVLLSLVQDINHRINRDVRPQAESGLGEDRWRRPGAKGAGDCEDYAIEKREELKAAGFPAEDLSYAMVYRRDTGLHTILVARVGVESYVLDNLSPRVVKAAQAPYTWVKQQSHADPKLWQAALAAPGNDPNPAVGMAASPPRHRYLGRWASFDIFGGRSANPLQSLIAPRAEGSFALATR